MSREASTVNGGIETPAQRLDQLRSIVLTQGASWGRRRTGSTGDAGAGRT